ncbi:hypothetical protein VNO77_12416 [Canavalia gladiata]|uniref:Uncharacterized protein n=1 Tax=Canavalia gladiata TaxID=3824 RepID=A0AAN9QMT8_CANGL
MYVADRCSCGTHMLGTLHLSCDITHSSSLIKLPRKAKITTGPLLMPTQGMHNPMIIRVRIYSVISQIHSN